MGEAIEKATLSEVHQLANTIKSAAGMLPKHLVNNPGAIVATVLAGQELGLGPMAAMRGLHLVNGKVGISADLMGALAVRAGYEIKWLATTDKAATVKLTRRSSSETHEHTFTIEEAKAAGLLGNDPWKKYAPAMLRARCLSAACRAFAPEALFGCYHIDELDEIKRKPMRVTIDPDRAANAGQAKADEAPVDAEVVEDSPALKALLDEALGVTDESTAESLFRGFSKQILSLDNDEKASLWHALLQQLDMINADRERGSYFRRETLKAMWSTATMPKAHDPTTGEVADESAMDERNEDDGENF